PLTAVLTHGKRPFFAGTYFPKESRMGRMGMLQLVPTLAEAWRGRRGELERQAEHVMQHVRGEPDGHGDGEAPVAEAAGPLGLDALARGAAMLRQRFDAAHGGFGGAPKFPSPHLLLFLLRWHHRTGDRDTLGMVERTLDAMSAGGVRDHLGGGFHRYATDRAWLVPHFEKMLYDQAMLALAFVEAHQVTGKTEFAATARQTLDYVLRHLADPAGGFRCAEDADSEGVEGKFYVWTKAETLGVLGAAGERFCKAYGVTAEGNYHDEATRSTTGANIPHLETPLAAAEEAALAPLRARLLAARGKRIRPGLDDKVLTDWNGLAIAAFAAAGRILREPRYVEAATKAATFLQREMRTPGGLRHRFRAGVRDDSAFLDDYAFLLWGLTEIYAATYEPHWLAWALEVAGQLEAWFAAPAGGFFRSPSGGEDLGVRRKEGYDGAIPSGNSAAALALLRLGLLSGETRWTVLGERTLAAFAAGLSGHPAAYAMMLCALDLALGPSREVVVAGAGPEADAMLRHVGAVFAPRTVALAVRPGLAKVAPWTEAMGAPGGAAAYVCEGFACKAPVTSARSLAALLAAAGTTTPGARAPGP
ncbi:MAG: thioredoxin domain-containing protein, partial [Halobacteriales archaeon]|nr:thioredoxin domain-containing protein [Halobacteriales archaeon]